MVSDYQSTKPDIADRLWGSDAASALTNEGAREIERLRDQSAQRFADIDRLQMAINEAYRIMCSGTPPHSARETNARRVLRLAGVTAKEQIP